MSVNFQNKTCCGNARRACANFNYLVYVGDAAEFKYLSEIRTNYFSTKEQTYVKVFPN